MSDDLQKRYGLSERAYSFGYQIRQEQGNLDQSALAWIENHVDLLMPDQAPSSVFRILSLGCGQGRFDLQLIQLLFPKVESIEYVGLDISAVELQGFRKRLEQLPDHMQSKIQLVCQPFEVNTRLKGEWHLVVMGHFLHPFAEPKVSSIIQAALAHLSPSGRLLVLQTSEKGVPNIRKQFASDLGAQTFLSSEQLQFILEKEQIDFELEVIRCQLKVDLLKQASLEALLLMSFCFTTDLSLFDLELQAEIRKAFLTASHEDPQHGKVLDEMLAVFVCNHR